MSTVEIFERAPSDQERAAEAMASQVRENLLEFIGGEREDFEAHFAIGQGGLHDEAHLRFLDSLGEVEPGEGFMVTSDGTKLYVKELCYSTEEGGRPFHIIYSSQPTDY